MSLNIQKIESYNTVLNLRFKQWIWVGMIDAYKAQILRVFKNFWTYIKISGLTAELLCCIYPYVNINRKGERKNEGGEKSTVYDGKAPLIFGRSVRIASNRGFRMFRVSGFSHLKTCLMSNVSNSNCLRADFPPLSRVGDTPSWTRSTLSCKSWARRERSRARKGLDLRPGRRHETTRRNADENSTVRS